MYSSLVSPNNRNQANQNNMGKRYSIPNTVLIRSPYQNSFVSPQTNILSSSTNNKSILSTRQQIVYIDDKAFIAAKKDIYSNNNSHHKIIEINPSRSKSSRNNTNSIKKPNNPKQPLHQPNIIPVQTAITTRQENSVDKKQKQNYKTIQTLKRKIEILQHRISQLHLQKQNSQIKFTHHNNLLIRQLQLKQSTIQQLQHKLEILSSELQNKHHDLKLAEQEVKKYRQKQEQRVCAERDQYKSLTTQNFINLALTEQIQKVRQYNHQLQTQLLNYRTQNSKYSNRPSIKQNKQISHSDSKLHDLIMLNNQQVSIQQSDEIIQVDSQHMQIDDIINQIHSMAKNNEQLQIQLQECRNQLFIKDSIATETARIMQEIKQVVMDTTNKNGQINKIRQILTQIY